MVTSFITDAGFIDFAVFSAKIGGLALPASCTSTLTLANGTPARENTSATPAGSAGVDVTEAATGATVSACAIAPLNNRLKMPVFRAFTASLIKLFLREKIKHFPRGGRGQLKKLSEHLNVNSVVISQIFKGDRELTSEQGFEVSDFLALSSIEHEYFLLLIQYGRSGTHRYKKHLFQIK